MISDGLSKREKVLILVLSIILVIFLYINFIREPIVDNLNNYSEKVENFNSSLYESIKVKNRDLNSEIVNYKNCDNKNTYNSCFGKDIDISQSAINLGLKFESSTTSNLKRQKFSDKEVNFIECNNYIEGDLNSIYNLLEEIKLNKYLFVEEVDITRRGKSNFGLNLMLRQYTFEDLPYTGIVSIKNEDLSNEDISLIDSLYGEKKVEENEDKSEESSKNTKVKTSTAKASKEEPVVTKTDNLNPQEEKEIEEINNIPSTVNYKTQYEEIDVKKQKVLAETYLTKYRNENDVKMVIDTKYFKENEQLFTDDPHYTKSIKFDNKSGQVEVIIDDELNLKSAPIVIEEPKDFYAFEFNTVKNGKIYLQMKASNDAVVTIEAKKRDEGWEVIEFEIPEEAKSYPIKVFNFSAEDEIGVNHGIIRNFAGFNEK